MHTTIYRFAVFADRHQGSQIRRALQTAIEPTVLLWHRPCNIARQKLPSTHFALTEGMGPWTLHPPHLTAGCSAKCVCHSPMERVLTQEEIDAMVRNARGGQGEAKKVETRSIQPCTFRQSGQLTGDQVAAVNGLHEGFARSLTQSLGAYLRVTFDVNLVSVEQLSYSEFLGRVPEVTYMTSLRVEPMGASAAMQIDHSLVFPLIDVLLGGTGACEVLTREVSEIEDQIIQGVAKIICAELDAAWTPLDMRFHLEDRQPPAQMQRFLSPTEKTLCLSFEVKLVEARGALNLVFPVSISNTLLRKLSCEPRYGGSRTNERTSSQIITRMLNCLFPVQLAIPGIQLPVNALLNLQPEAICVLGIPVQKPASLMLAGREVFEAKPVRRGRRRAAHLDQPLSVPNEGVK